MQWANMYWHNAAQVSDPPSCPVYLHRCDWTLLGSGDSLLHGTHVSGQSGLVTHGRGDTTQQGRHLINKMTWLVSSLPHNIFNYTASGFKITTLVTFPVHVTLKTDMFFVSQTSEPACVKRKMLSMKSSTSWPSWSRKYSATVSPVRATLARAPGGSFICPYTSAT